MPPHTINRTSYVPTRRADSDAAKVTGTVPSGLLPQNGKGRRCQRRPVPLLRWGHSQSEVPRPDGRQRPLVPHDTSARPARTTATPTSVYRYLDADGVLIYVGITNRGVQRQGEHNTHAKWWRFVRSQEVEHYDDRETALRRERYLIEKHQPPFNVVHNAEHTRRLAAYLKHATPAAEPCKFDGPVGCEEPDYCPAFYPGVNDDWCGVPGCMQCHRVWHIACEANGHGVEWDELTFTTDLAIFCGSENVAVACAAFDLMSALQRLACALDEVQGPMSDPDWPARLRRRMPSASQLAEYAPVTLADGGA